MIKIHRPDIKDAPSWYPYFFDLATGDDLITALQSNQQRVQQLLHSIPSSFADYRYAADKWSVKQVFIHLADDERYYAYKSFCYSRQIDVHLEVPAGAGYAKDFNAANRTLADIGAELLTIREATISLFSSMTDDMLDFKGFTGKDIYTARSLGWMAVGHSIHHCNILRDKYLG
jgi:hypothetical protein